MVKAYCYFGEGKEKHVIKAEDISEHISEEKKFIWVDIEDATKQDIDLVAKEFDIHNLSVEDVLSASQRPKLEQFDNYLFVVIYGVDFIPAENRLVAQEVHIFLGVNFIVTVRNRSPQLYDGEPQTPFPAETFMNAWDNQRQELKEKGAPMVLYTIADTLVDKYFSVNDVMEDRLDKIEDLIFESPDTKDVMEDLYRFKKDLLSYRRVVAPLKDVMHTLTSRDIEISGQRLFDLQAVLYFQDVYDHIIRIQEAIDTYRDLLTSALEVQLSVVSNRLNEIMKKLTSIAAIIAVPTLIVGIYGMNFKFMPELHYRYAYFVVLGLMAISSGIIAYFFRKYKWF
jgi:magnesium transporter